MARALRANEQKAEAVVIERYSGRPDTSMRDIVKGVGSEVPVIVYVSPSERGSVSRRFITLAAHVAAMSRARTGSAHPVGVGEKMDKAM